MIKMLRLSRGRTTAVKKMHSQHFILCRKKVRDNYKVNDFFSTVFCISHFSTSCFHQNINIMTNLFTLLSHFIYFLQLCAIVNYCVIAPLPPLRPRKQSLWIPARKSTGRLQCHLFHGSHSRQSRRFWSMVARWKHRLELRRSFAIFLEIRESESGPIQWFTVSQQTRSVECFVQSI